MYCSNCGSNNLDQAKFCSSCGQKIVHNDDLLQPLPRELTLGFSANDTDISIIKSRSKRENARWRALIIITLLFFGVIQLIWVTQEGRVSFDSIKIGLIVAAFPLVILLPFILKETSKKTWAGTIKKIKTKKSTHSRGDIDEDRHATTSYTYNVIVDLDSFGKKKVSYSNSKINAYYSVGDKVKYHKGFDYLEKFDKTKHKSIPCINCFTMNEPQESHCSNCGLILMK